MYGLAKSIKYVPNAVYLIVRVSLLFGAFGHGIERIDQAATENAENVVRCDSQRPTTMASRQLLHWAEAGRELNSHLSIGL